MYMWWMHRYLHGKTKVWVAFALALPVCNDLALRCCPLGSIWALLVYLNQVLDVSEEEFKQLCAEFAPEETDGNWSPVLLFRNTKKLEQRFGHWTGHLQQRDTQPMVPSLLYQPPRQRRQNSSTRSHTKSRFPAGWNGWSNFFGSPHCFDSSETVRVILRVPESKFPRQSGLEALQGLELSPDVRKVLSERDFAALAVQLKQDLGLL